jgi:hypothetical protein
MSFKSIAASITKFTAYIDGVTAIWAGEFELMATFAAELSLFTIIKLTLRAFHYLALRLMFQQFERC